MIVVRLFEGLGNQLFQYAMGRALAERHKVPLRLDVRWFSGDQSGEQRLSPRRRFALDAFCIEAPQATPRDLAYCVGSKEWIPRVRDKFMRRGGDIFPRVLDTFKKFNRAAAESGPNIYLDGYWQSPRYFEHVAPMLRREFELRDCPAVRQAEASEHEFRAGGVPLVSVHVRRGDLIPVERDGALLRNAAPPTSAGFLKEAMDRFDDSARFVIVSDPADRPWCRENVAGRDVVYFDGMNDIADFSMLRRCDHHVVASSTFSWWAAWLNDRPGKRVMAPAAWYWPDDPSGRVAADIVPKDWSTIEAEVDRRSMRSA